MSSNVLTSNLAKGFYPEKPAPDEGVMDRAMGSLMGHARYLRRAGLSRFRNIVPAVNKLAGSFNDMSGEEMGWQVQALRYEVRSHGFDLERTARIFALVREVASRRLQMRHFDVQLVGGWILLNGMIAEMQTGEGKTLTATLPAVAVALAGVPVHVITVNDYLTRRDAEWMGPVYRALGLTVGAITTDMTLEQRRWAYRCDITYCTNKEVVFDYLRDRLDMGQRPGPLQRRVQKLISAPRSAPPLRLRGLCFAIVDEADSVLIDEARTPLIISGRGDASYEAQIYQQALDLSERLEVGADYYIDFPKREIELTDLGRQTLEMYGENLGGYWNGRLRREEVVQKALSARHLFIRDKHYVVREGKVEIVDEYTGRIMPNRSWEGGLHQLIETKEGCEITARTEVMGRISYQRFFRRYLVLCGMTGTAREASRELWSVYRLKVVTVPTNCPLDRSDLGTHVHKTADEKWAAIVTRIKEIHRQGRPVLVGTRTVAASRHLSELLLEEGLTCTVLNALQDQEEARIVSQAGQLGQITVATNMAGRGTDIKLGHEVAELGGLHVLATERHDARRIDRQLFGRCGRQGEPGSFECFVSLEDELLESHPAKVLGFLGPDRLNPVSGPGRVLSRRLFTRAQKRAERRHFHIRKDLLKMDESLDSALAFSGKGE